MNTETNDGNGKAQQTLAPTGLLGARPITPEDVIKEADRNYDLGRKHGRDETMENLCNETKIRFCNAVDALRRHWLGCDDCAEYIYWGDGDLCPSGKHIIAMELAYADTSVSAPNTVIMRHQETEKIHE